MLRFAFTPQHISNATKQFCVPPARMWSVVALWQLGGSVGFEQGMAVTSNSSPVIRIACTVTLVTSRVGENCKSSCYHSSVEYSAIGLQLVCCLLAAQRIPCGREGFSQGVSSRRPGVDMDANVSYLASESRYSGTGSLPQSSTGTRYGHAHICSDITHFAHGRYNDYWCAHVYLQFTTGFLLHFVVKFKAHCNHAHPAFVIKIPTQRSIKYFVRNHPLIWIKMKAIIIDFLSDTKQSVALLDTG
jgi:hypothetical protein